MDLNLVFFFFKCQTGSDFSEKCSILYLSWVLTIFTYCLEFVIVSSFIFLRCGSYSEVAGQCFGGATLQVEIIHLHQAMSDTAIWKCLLLFLQR